jgi:hypothetical protein
MTNLTCDEALRLMTDGFPIEKCIVTERLDIRRLGDLIEFDVIIRDSVIIFFDCPSVEFKGKVLIENCQIVKSAFNYAYFINGLEIRNSSFKEYVDFEAGGHNENGAIILDENSFNGFVNFFDCWFKGPVIIKGNVFGKGSNLLGNKEEEYKSVFDGIAIIENNTGRVDLDGEGDKQVNVIYFNRETGEGFNALQ